MEFGQWFKQKRQALDLTQESLAEAISCAIDTVRKIESGRRRPSRQLADLLADYFHVPPEEHAAFVHWARGLGSSEQEHHEDAVEPAAGQPDEPGETENAPWSHFSSVQTTTVVATPP